ncbi:hypothetical protein [Streptosporangium sp. NPDC087985]|uniref:hypothetical protein n=1 Tax=Streptosporangium sp. NPDC087985 TaxID=3366196 RepID=UPI00381FB607
MRGTVPAPEADLTRRREVVDAFLAAARRGDFDALVAVLDPEVVLRVDYGAVPAGVSGVIRGAQAVARQALIFSRFARFARPVLVNGAAGLLTAPDGQPISVVGFTVRRGRIAGIDILADPARLRRLDVTIADD